MHPKIVVLGLLAAMAWSASPIWFIQDAWPIIDSQACFAFRAPQSSEGSTILAVPVREQRGELLKEDQEGTWKPLAARDILQGQVVLACQCGDVFVMPALWPKDPQRLEPWKAPCTADVS